MSQIKAEIAEIPLKAAEAIARGAEAGQALSADFHAAPPHLFLTLARGSSGAAAAYGRALFSSLLGRPAGQIDAASPAFYGADMRFSDAWLIAVSQSGHSPDTLDTLIGFRRAAGAGAKAIALVNDTTSPLAAEAGLVIDQAAGPEHSVAATKSVICSMAALARLAAGLAGDKALIEALDALPDALTDDVRETGQLAGFGPLPAARSAFTLGRDLSFPAASEAALKMKETCILHAEAQDSAEVMHGPRALIEPGYPVVAFRPAGPAAGQFDQAVTELTDLGAEFLQIDVAGGGAASHPAVRPIRQLARFYAGLPGLATARGVDADAPRNLTKVTRTA